MRPIDAARRVEYPEGSVVFDPVGGVVRVLSGESRLILDHLAGLIADGVVGRQALLDLLMAELDEDGEPVDESARQRLMLWVDLARNVYA